MILIRPASTYTIGAIKVLIAQQLLTTGKLNLAHKTNGTEIILEDDRTLESYQILSKTCLVLSPDERTRLFSEENAEFAKNFHKARRRSTADLTSEKQSYADMFFEACMTGDLEYVMQCARDSPQFLI